MGSNTQICLLYSLMETVSYRDKIIECKTKYELLYTILFNLIKQHCVYIILTIAYKKDSFVYTAHSIVYLIHSIAYM